MPSYENIYIKVSDGSDDILNFGDGVSFSGTPGITLTWVKDRGWNDFKINKKYFSNVISIGCNTWVDSLNHLAFHNGQVKLTSVKINDGHAGKIIIGERVVLQGTAIVSYKSVTVEDDVIFGPNVTIMDSSGHPILGRGTDNEASRIDSRAVHIKEHAWIGLNAIILKGVTIGAHAVIGAGSVVSEDIPDYAIATGNPAKVVKYIVHDKR